MTETAFRSHYETFRDPLFRFGYRLTGSVEVSEDLVHDCFLGLFRGGFDERRASIRTYLYAAMRNLCRKHYRDFGNEDLADEIVQPAAVGPLDALITLEIAERVLYAVATLPLLQREVLVLFEYEELPLDEISEIVGADIGAVKSRLFRARTRLRSSLAGCVSGPLMKEASQ
jgi:RNA polymerase sigma factor (sigma-70 family)